MAEAGRGKLCLDWGREVAGKMPNIDKCKTAQPFDQPQGLDLWFGQRQYLKGRLSCEYIRHERFGEVCAYTLLPEPDPASYKGWDDAYHGTIMYAIANIARYGKLLCSEAKSLSLIHI